MGHDGGGSQSGDWWVAVPPDSKSRFGRRCWVWDKLNVRSLRHGQVARSGAVRSESAPLLPGRSLICPHTWCPRLCNEKT